MTEHGYKNFSQPMIRSWTTFPGGGGPFGYVNYRYARLRGFHPPAQQGLSAMTMAEARTDLACNAQISAQFRPMTLADEQLLTSLYDESASDTENDERVRRAVQAWSQCMKSDGFDDSNPAALARGPWGADPSASERSTAEADAACTSTVNLAGIYFAVLAGYQREQVGANASQLARIGNDSRSAVDAAARIVAANS